MKTTPLVACVLSALASCAAVAECTPPGTPKEPPSGASASRDEMRAAQDAIRAYDVAVNAYAECIQKNGYNKQKADDALRTLQRLADAFNSELRAFKQKNGS
jgi:hypothetical protein